MTVKRLTTLLHEHDDGVLRAGAHSEGREFCAYEFKHKVLGHNWSDVPDGPDYRRLNDARWSSDVARTAGLLPVMVALWEWSVWTAAQQTRWWEYVAVETVKQIIAELPGLSEEVRVQCRAVTDRTTAKAAALKAQADTYDAYDAYDASAAYAAAYASASAAYAYASAYAAAYASASAAYAYASASAYAAAYASASAAYAYASASAAAYASLDANGAGDAILNIGCQIWVTGAEVACRS